VKASLLDLATIAVAMATETAEHADSAVMATLLDALPEGTDEHLFVALLRTYQHQRRSYGEAAVQRAALAYARRACGLDP
jgi:hypothetical protein